MNEVKEVENSSRLLAERIGISRSHLVRLARSGEIPGAFKKSGRWFFPETPELQTWVGDFQASGRTKDLSSGSHASGPDRSQGVETTAVSAGPKAAESRTASGFSGQPVYRSAVPRDRSEISREAGQSSPSHTPTRGSEGWIDPLEQGRHLGRLGIAFYVLPLVVIVLTGTAIIFIGMLGASMDQDNLAISIAANGEQILFITSLAGLLSGLAGAAMMFFALHGYGVRDRWLFWGAVLPSIPWAVLLFPFGLLLGGVVVTVLLWQVQVVFSNR